MVRKWRGRRMFALALQVMGIGFSALRTSLARLTRHRRKIRSRPIALPRRKRSAFWRRLISLAKVWSVVWLLAVCLGVCGQTPSQKPAPLRELAGHTELVYQLAWSPDGRLIASAGFDNSIRFWEADSGKLVRTVSGPPTGQTVLALHVAFSPDGQHLAGAFSDNQVRIWDVPLAVPVRSLEAGSEALTTLAITSDGNRVAVAGKDGIIRLVNLADGKVLATCAGHTGRITGLAFNGNGQQLASVSEDLTLRIWNVADGKPLAVIGAHASRPNAVAFHSNGQAIYTADAEGVLKFWSWPVPPSRTVAAPEGVTVAATSPDASRIVVVGTNRVPQIWNVNSGQVELSLPALAQVPRAIAWSPKGTPLAFALADRRCVVFDLGQKKERAVLEPLGAEVTSLAISPDGGQILIALADGSLRIHQLADGKPAGNWPAHAGGVLAAHYLPNGLVISAGADKVLHVWTPDGKSARRVDIGDIPQSLAVSRDGVRAAVGLAKGVRWWNLSDGKEMPALPQPAPVTVVQFSPDGTRLAIGRADGRCAVWDLNTAREIQFFLLDGAVKQLAWTANSANLLASTEKTALAILGLASVRWVPAHTRSIQTLVLTPNLSHAVTASADGTVRLVNLGNAALERQHATPHGSVTAISVARNGAFFVTAGMDKSLRFWNPSDGKELRSVAVPAIVRGLAFTPNNSVLLAALDNGQVLAFDVAWQPGQPIPANWPPILQEYQQPASDTPTVVVHPTDNATWFSVSGDKLLRVWRIASMQPVRALPGHTQMVDALAYSPDGKQLASVGHDGILRLWDPASGRELRGINIAVQPQPQPLYAVAWLPDGKHVLVAGLNRKIVLVDVTNGTVVREFRAYDEKQFPRGHRDSVFSLAVLGSTQFISAGADGQIKLWNLADGQVLQDFVDPEVPTKGQAIPKAHADFVSQIRLSPDGKYLLSVGSRGSVKIWKLENRQVVSRWQLGQPSYAGLWSPDGKRLAISLQDGRVVIFATPALP